MNMAMLGNGDLSELLCRDDLSLHVKRKVRAEVARRVSEEPFVKSEHVPRVRQMTLEIEEERYAIRCIP